MSRIQALSAQVVNKIAAGEVIERPASVVKELLENSVDALASRIEVEIVDGGTELIRIVDDGEGIHPEDLILAVSSHATSKLQDADDLFKVQTLGFRGEALASIAEVSRFSIKTRQADSLEGTEMIVDCGRADTPRPCGAPFGTQIDVAQLFINTPVRRKFLKTTSTEFGHIAEQFTKIALANPRIHMVLTHNGKTVYDVPAAARVLDRLTLFYGSDLTDQLIPVESTIDNIRLYGYVAHPAVSKATRKGEWLFLNGRWIQDRALQHALSEAYRGLLMVGRNPVCFLFLELPADQVDVNVHPTKSEVRFRDGQRLYRQLLSALRTKFLAMNLNSQLKVDPQRPAATDKPPVAPEQQRQAQLDLLTWVNDRMTQWSDSPAAEPGSTIGVPEPSTSWNTATALATLPSPQIGESPYVDESSATGHVASPTMYAVSTNQRLPAAPTVSGQTGPGQTVAELTDVEVSSPTLMPRAMQVHDLYLVVETSEGLQVVDQHALHERILYEQIRQRILKGPVESQRLLIPETIEVTTTELEMLREHRPMLVQFGLLVEEFGGNTVIVTAYPVMLRRSSPQQILRDVLDELASSNSPTRRDMLDSLLHMMSCKAAVKAGQRLSPAEIDSLLAWRHLIEDAHHCPHGRPTALNLSRADLDRQFGRLG